MNALSIALAALQAAPTVVAGIEYLSKEAPSATKQQLALDSLTVLTSGISAAVPSAASLSTELNTVFSSIINLTVTSFNAAGIFSHKPAANVPAPATPQS